MVPISKIFSLVELETNTGIEDLAYIASQEDFTQRDDVEPLQTSEFTILHPDQGMTFGGM